MLETTRGVRLSYVRWLVILGLAGFHALEFLLASLPIALDTAFITIGGYALLNLIIWLVSLTFGKGNNTLVNITLMLDLIITTAISTQFNSQLFYFPYIYCLLIMILLGLWEGVAASVVVAGVDIATVFLKVQKFDLRTTTTSLPISLELFGLMISVLIFGLAVYIITNTATPLTRLQDELLEEAVARANTSNMTELQNRIKAVYRVARTLNQTLDPQKVIADMLIELETVFDVSVGVVMLFDEQSHLGVVDGLRLSPEERRIKITTFQGVLREIMMRGEPTLVNEAGQLEELHNLLPSLKGCLCVAMMPMRGGFEVFGLVVIGSRQENGYTPQDLEWLMALTSHPVISLQNAKLLHSITEDRNKTIRDVEEIRHTLARNLHDGPAQAVAAFSMQAEFIRRLIKSDPDKAVEELSTLGKQAQQTSKEIRTLLYELRPLALESQGLDSALEQYASRFPTNPDDPKVFFSTTNFNGRLAPNVETTIFTILQEAVNNARKHAKAKNMWLSLEIKDGYVIASAQDDGKGFDVKAVETNYERRGSLGMTNMRERAALVNGSVKLDSVPGRGTIVILRIPLNEANTRVPPEMNGQR